MTDLNHFRVVLRGYDPAQVARRVRVLTEHAESAGRQIEELSSRVRQLEEERERADAAGPPSMASFKHLGDRVGQILGRRFRNSANTRLRAIR